MEINEIEREIFLNLVQNEIKSNESFIEDLEGEELKCWKNETKELQRIKYKLSPLEIVLI